MNSYTYIQDVSAEKVGYGQEIEDIKKRQQKQNEMMIRQLCTNKQYQRDFDKLIKKQEQEINLKQKQVDEENQSREIGELRKKHAEETNAWIQEHVKKASENKSYCIL